MARVRIGFGCAPAALVREMQPFRNNVISILGARAMMAALELGQEFVKARREKRMKLRDELCAWLTSQRFRFLPPQANFVLIDIRQPVAAVIPKMLAQGVAVGRRFDGVDNWMRVAIGTSAEMEKFRIAFRKVAG